MTLPISMGGTMKLTTTLILVLVLAVAPGLRAEPVSVFAAASLTESFDDIGRLYRLHYGQPVAFNFGATNDLRMQIEHGARADVFASASSEEMDRAVASHSVTGAAQVFAHNRLLVITPKDNPGHVESIRDLGRPGLRFVTTHPNVPVGKYTLAMLEAMGRDPAYGPAWRDAALKNIASLELNVKQVASKVLLGEADAGVVYVSDVTPRTEKHFRSFPVPEPFNVDAKYPIAVAATTKASEAARRFIDLVLSPEGQKALARHRFGTGVLQK